MGVQFHSSISFWNALCKVQRKIFAFIKNHYVICLVLVSLIFTLLLLSSSNLEYLMTVTNSFMNETEISAGYGKIFSNLAGKGKYVSSVVHLKFIPDAVSFKQYATVLFNSPDYLFKFWNSVILVVPIVIFQMVIALLAAYGFTRYRGKMREIIFFAYVILMLTPYQVTLVPNYLVSDALVGVIAQRLVKRLCPACKKRGKTNAREMEILGISDPISIARPQGCQFCNNTGYKGRIAVHEIMYMNEDMKNCVSREKNLETLREKAGENGMCSLWDSCRSLVVKGVTSVQELMSLSVE